MFGSLFISILLVFASLVYTEHPILKPFKALSSTLGFHDSIYEIRGLSDIKATDHAIGVDDAELVLIEYSDYSCFWCASMRDIFNEFLENRKAKLVYRHFYPTNRPSSIRNSSLDVAVSAECVSRLLGNEAFWKYTEIIYDNQQNLDDNFLLKSAVGLGVKSIDYRRCISEEGGGIKDELEESTKEVVSIGARGTPFVLFVLNGEIIGFSYAITDYDRFLEIINEAISKTR